MGSFFERSILAEDRLSRPSVWIRSLSQSDQVAKFLDFVGFTSFTHLITLRTYKNFDFVFIYTQWKLENPTKTWKNTRGLPVKLANPIKTSISLTANCDENLHKNQKLRYFRTWRFSADFFHSRKIDINRPPNRTLTKSRYIRTSS